MNLIRSLFQKLYKALILILILYFAIGLAVFAFQEKLIFQSRTLPVNYSYSFNQPFQEYFIPTSDKESLNALFFPSPSPSKGLILYAHGNADNLERWGKYAKDFTSLGYDILMHDYRGYGKSTGTPNENDFYRDANDILQWAQYHLKYTRLIFYGRSMGSAVASHLATEENPDLLILETPFDEIKNVVYWPLKPLVNIFPLKTNFSNKNSLHKTRCKTIIFHGTEDWVVPLSSALKLKPLLRNEKDFIIIDGAGHRNLSDFPSYHSNLARILNEN